MLFATASIRGVCKAIKKLPQTPLSFRAVPARNDSGVKQPALFCDNLEGRNDSEFSGMDFNACQH